MKLIKRSLFIIALVIIAVIAYNYSKLNILAGYSAKNSASSVFLANRNLAFTDSTDNNFSPVNLASDKIDTVKKTATSSAFGLLTRTAIYRDGVGVVLTLDKADETATYLKPKRTKIANNLEFPYGDKTPKDTLFSNINYTALNNAVTSIFGADKTRGVVVVYKDKIIAEQYAKGFNKTSKFLGWSMTKSVLSTVYGVLEYQNKLKVSQNAPIASWQNDARKHITLNNLLQMNSGLAWEEDYNTISDVTKMLFLERDMTKKQAEKQLVGQPNNAWYYSSGTSNLLSGILRQQFKTHQAYLDFWYTDLIDKIGMQSMLVETDLAGNYVASSYAWATARDWAKFGLLYLNKGNWNGTQIFSKDWANYVATPTPTSNGTYGAQFWLNSSKTLKDVPANMYYADGYQGQRVYVLPDKDMVVVRLGLANFDENTFLKKILNAVK